MTYELNLKRSNEIEIKKKSLALKANLKNKEPNTESESSSFDEDIDEFLMFTRRFQKFLKREGKSFRRSPFLNKKSSKSSPASLKKPDKIVCYNCRKSGHIQIECPETSRVRSSKVKGKKFKVMICTWSDESDEDDEDEDSSSDEKDKKSKLCLMAIGEEDNDEIKFSFEDYSLSD